jgi:hypothetical protein
MGWEALDRCEKAFRAFIRPRVANTGYGFGDSLAARVRPLALQLPERAKNFAKAFVNENARTRICMILGSGSNPNRTPPTTFWRQLCDALIHEFGDVEIILLGALGGTGTLTQGVLPADIAQLVSEFPQVRDGFDKGLLNQLALAETCDLDISPHTGMSFAIQSVGVPWLALSGGEPVESLLNGVPFFSVFPECGQYVCGPWLRPSPGEMLAECKERKATGEPFLCLTETALLAKLPEILGAARQLVGRELTYHECFDRHYRELLPRVNRQPGEWFFDAGQDSDFVFRRVRDITSNKPMQATPNGAPDG